jgi:hypothetical protein
MNGVMLKKQKISYKRREMIRDCYCHTCEEEYHHMGIQSHRAKHRNRLEDCTITYSNGKTCTNEFSKYRPKAI